MVWRSEKLYWHNTQVTQKTKTRNNIYTARMFFIVLPGSCLGLLQQLLRRLKFMCWFCLSQINSHYIWQCSPRVKAWEKRSFILSDHRDKPFCFHVWVWYSKMHKSQLSIQFPYWPPCSILPRSNFIVSLTTKLSLQIHQGSGQSIDDNAMILRQKSGDLNLNILTLSWKTKVNFGLMSNHYDDPMAPTPLKESNSTHSATLDQNKAVF